MAEVTASLSIGQVAERTGLSVHALRFYEQEGLFVSPVRRGPGRASRLHRGRRGLADRLRHPPRLRHAAARAPPVHRPRPGGRRATRRNDSRSCASTTSGSPRQIGRLTQCLDLITFKVGVYEDLGAGSIRHPDRVHRLELDLGRHRSRSGQWAGRDSNGQGQVVAGRGRAERGSRVSVRTPTAYDPSGARRADVGRWPLASSGPAPHRSTVCARPGVAAPPSGSGAPATRSGHLRRPGPPPGTPGPGTVPRDQLR